jgi:hypothetical protein
MDYELAKKLSDKGFPRENILESIDGEYQFPTLEELIEACGEGFYSLENWGEQGYVACDQSNFVNLSCGCCSEDRQQQFIAKTPTEAVANLWLALNTKV